MIDVIRGNAVFIGDHRIVQEFLNFREFVVEGNKDKWLISLKLDYKHEIKIVNKYHSKHKQIVKLINMSMEHGIECKRHNLYKHGMLMLIYLFKRFIDQDVITIIKNEIDKRRKQISFDELSSVFFLFFISLPISIIIFVIELILYLLKK